MISKEQFIIDFKSVMDISSDINMDTDLLDIEEWDSFSAMAFLAMVDEKYGVKVEPFSIAEAILVEDLYNVLK